MDGTVTLESERRWCGLTVWAVLPVPLKLPVCSEYVEVDFADDKPVTRREGWVGPTLFVGCGPGVWFASEIANGRDASFCAID